MRKAANDRLLDLAVKSGVPITFGIAGGSNADAEDHLKLLDATAAAGGRMFGQTHTRGISHVLSFKGRLQFDDFPEWARAAQLPIEEQRKAFSDPEQRKTPGRGDQERRLSARAAASRASRTTRTCTS